MSRNSSQVVTSFTTWYLPFLSLPLCRNSLVIYMSESSARKGPRRHVATVPFVHWQATCCWPMLPASHHSASHPLLQVGKACRIQQITCPLDIKAALYSQHNKGECFSPHLLHKWLSNAVTFLMSYKFLVKISFGFYLHLTFSLRLGHASKLY